LGAVLSNAESAIVFKSGSFSSKSGIGIRCSGALVQQRPRSGSSPERSHDPYGIRHADSCHLVEHPGADRYLRLLSRQTPGAELASDDPLVSGNSRLDIP
jgi:hypothetical protein